MRPKKRLVVIGGGAAGFFCAVNAARMNSELEVIIVEKTSKLLAKVRISGGGRCNVTHNLADISEMSRRYPRGQNFVKKTFHQFFTSDTIQWFETRGVKIKAEADGRIFPVTDDSETIIECLLREASKYKVQIKMNAPVEKISKDGDQFIIKFSAATAFQNLQSDFICIACGGYPKTSMFQWLIDLGHTISEPVPSLFTFNLPANPISQLMGVRVETVRMKIEGSKLEEEGSVLITHWGLSGPVVLKLSAWGAREFSNKNYKFKIHINWLPEFTEQNLKEKFISFRSIHATKKISNHRFEEMPNRLWLFLLQHSGITEDMRFADMPSKIENALIKNLVDYVAEVNGKTTYKEEFVTAGGIGLNEVDANTMMSKKIENIFFAGEILDVDGLTGGFNFQHAWTSGYIAASVVAREANNE